MIVAIMRDFDRLSLTGCKDWEIAVGICEKLIVLKRAFEQEKKKKKKAEEARLEEMRKAREAQLKAAEERGEDIVGGETIRFNADGTEEVLIP